MDVNGLLDISFVILQWVVDWMWIFCAIVFALIMVKTLIDVSRRLVDDAAPGFNKLTGGKKG